ncbi:hypothetical protein RSSM_04995 [Rhodopirellula sallentina SM41]|uniref:DUF6966 domain-containing protein n=2 Tax=Rhodopirellula TaxID=265488 RepID=M5U6R3_9BACT|nr:hypothetical protein RSSM_04995 [Rhodopirellula sallentina SM41]
MNPEHRAAQLQTLIERLRRLVPILTADADCVWARHFANCLHRAETFADGFTQDDLNGLSSSVMSVYGGMGSFNDYVAYGAGGRPVDGFAGLCGDVYDAALNLRVIEAQP